MFQPYFSKHVYTLTFWLGEGKNDLHPISWNIYDIDWKLGQGLIGTFRKYPKCFTWRQHLFTLTYDFTISLHTFFQMYHLRYKLRIFLFHRKLFNRNDPLLRHSGGFFLSSKPFTLPNLRRHEMSITTRVMVHFSISLSNHNSLCHENWSANSYKHGQYLNFQPAQKHIRNVSRKVH